MASATSIVSSSILRSSSVYLPISTSLNLVSSISTWVSPKRFSHNTSRNQENLICRAAEYKFPDPIPEFADAETEKFRDHLLKKLPKKKDVYGDSVEEIVGICTEWSRNTTGRSIHRYGRYHKREVYWEDHRLRELQSNGHKVTLTTIGRNGTVARKDNPIKWAQSHVDNDWKEWNSGKER